LTFRSGRLDLQGFSLLSPHASVVGDFGFDLPAFTNLSGGLSFQISDLSTGTQLSPIPIAGQIGGQIDLQGDDIRCHAIAKVLKAGPFLSQQVVLDLFAADIFHELKGKLSLEANNSYLADVYLSSASYSMGWNTRDWDYSLQAQGDWKHPFNISTAGHFAFSPRSFEIVCNSFAGSLLQKNLTLEQPLTFKLRTNEAQLADLRFKIDGGFIHSDFHIAPDVSKISVQAEHFPLDFLTLLSPRLSLQGLSSIDVDLAGTPSDLSGHCNILLEQADILPAGAKAPIQTKASLQANLQHDIFQFHTHIVATGEQLVEASGTLPIAYQLYPFQASLKPSKPLSGQCTIEGHVEQLFDFINIGSQRFGGFLSCHFVLSGTAEKPSLSGPLSVQGGFYQNYFIGMQLKNGNVEASANGSTIAVSSAQISDVGDGSASATAVFKLEPALPFKIEGTVSHFRPIEFDWLRASCSGPFTITGDLHKALAEGTLAIDDAEVQIPERLPGTIPTLPVTYVNQPPSFTPPKPAKVPYPFHYDLQINGKENIHLTGHGIDADLAGDIHMTGKNLKVTALGTLKTNKGKISFAGKDFQITDGEITFSENEGFINLTSKLDLPDLAVTVIFRGSFNSPQLIFESHPSLPTSSILARILFNKDVSELNASQAGQLAYTIFKLSGASGPNILETIHKNLGIDQLNFSVNEETGDVSIQVGKYLMQGVMITLTQSAEQSHVLVTVELKGGFVLQAETHFDDQGKYSFKWNKNY
jgi:translocation and assembly module TamB